MRLSPSEMKELASPASVAASLAGISLVIALVCYNMEQEARQQRDNAARDYDRIRTLSEQGNQETRRLQDLAARFEHYRKIGLLGEERRLDWVEALQDGQRRLQFPGMSYQLSPRRPLNGEADQRSPLYASTLTLHLQLVHEEDLLQFLAGLEKNARALVLVRRCELIRQSAAGGGLDAHCELDWITAGIKAETRP